MAWPLPSFGAPEWQGSPRSPQPPPPPPLPTLGAVISMGRARRRQSACQLSPLTTPTHVQSSPNLDISASFRDSHVTCHEWVR